ncbi:DUF1501 domain-containing protein [Pseudoxanthomonas composti]|uniref:DUF1501 domain-containing protein n=1 Tax=Pseudoxanthomonas composti TaxID=2137479 RepID=A0A4V1N0R8_9GAMM|nr:DUF1501 domain-containing protein [Pseudoxanthomonas composti]RXR01394.1 DUF1501 domain-containing protein [Pseudoxanthomonas composti]
MSHSTREDRRSFLRGLSTMLAGGAAYALLPQLELAGRAVAAEAPGDYRAMVCIFLFGGSDSYNMLIPHASGEYDIYNASRGGVYDATSNPFGLGIARDALLQVTDPFGKTWGLHPSCGGMKSLFDAGELAFLANIGTLATPVTKDEVNKKTKQLPSYLYSHNDQQKQWMGGSSFQSMSTGWGGRAADRLKGLNTGTPALPPGISLAGNNLYQLGASTLPYAVASSGPTATRRFSATGNAADKIRDQALQALIQRDYTPALTDQYGVVSDSAIQLNLRLQTALLPANGGDIATVFPSNNGLASQLRMIARLIKAGRSSAIGHRRQVFFASMGGFDTHQNQMAPNGHGALLGQLGDALAAFRTALAEINSLNDVVTFSMSDFGRTLNSNGNGTDHAWGGVQLVMGGSAANGGPLQGGRVWGDYPLLELNGPQSLGRGRMIPTMSVGQLGATVSSWFGVGNSELQTIFPGLNNFATARLPFLG